MSKRVLEIGTRGTRIDPQGTVSERGINNLNVEGANSANAYRLGRDDIVYKEVLAGFGDPGLRNEIRAATPIPERNRAWDQMEAQLENGKPVNLRAAIAALEKYDNTDLGGIVITHKDEPYGELLNEDILRKLERGDIKDATLRNLQIDTTHNRVNGGAFIAVENGRVKSMINGHEDMIPPAVQDMAAQHAKLTGQALTIQSMKIYDPGDKTISTEYRLLDDRNRPVVMDVKLNPQGGISFNTADQYAYLKNAPGGNGVNFGEGVGHAVNNPVRVVGRDPVVPRAPGPEVVHLQSHGFNLKREFISELEPIRDAVLSRAMETKPDPDVARLQGMIKKFSKMSPDVELDLGKSALTDAQMEAMHGAKIKDYGVEGRYINGNPVGIYSEGVDGMYGAKTERAVMQIQKSLGLEVTGVADQSLINAMDAKMTDLQKAEYAGRNVTFRHSNGLMEPQDASTPAQNTAFNSTPKL